MAQLANIQEFAQQTPATSQDILGEGLQAVATLIAVLLGFGLSLLAQRSERNRQREIERRRRLLDAVAELVDSLEMARSEAQHLAGLTDVNQDATTSIGELRAHDRAAVIRESSDPTLAALRTLRVDAIRLALFVDEPPEELDPTLEAAANVRASIAEVASQANAPDPSDALATLATSVNELTIDLDSLLPALEALVRRA